MPKVQPECPRKQACLRCWQKKIRCDRAHPWEACKSCGTNNQCTSSDVNTRKRSVPTCKTLGTTQTLESQLLNISRRMELVENALANWESQIPYSGMNSQSSSFRPVQDSWGINDSWGMEQTDFHQFSSHHPSRISAQEFKYM
ncbi:hypothetical protein B0H10DRAFT_2036683 [Mycena sp. CBHHK59/15]|nr:hypothetical protein B0H10DRAFT_2036683 [Mycena sp. CBHHK59/15]